MRQGDPLSSYLFVITMNVLSRLLDAGAQYGVFSYHLKCKKIKLVFSLQMIFRSFQRGHWTLLMEFKRYYSCSTRILVFS